MKKKLLFFFALLALAAALVGLFTTASSAATEGYYTYTVSNGKATVTDVSTSISGDITIPSTLGGYPVKSIGAWAFEDCSSLTSVTIGDGVTSIGLGAFAYCDSLTSVTIGDGVTSIGDGAFVYCGSLTSVTIGDGVTSIGGEAFEHCTSLTSVTIPHSVTNIYGYAFAYCDSLTSVTIGDGVTSIGVYAFSDCNSLTSVTIGDSVTSIGNYAFQGCTSLTSVTIPASVTSIGASLFSGCSALESITVKAGNAVYHSQNNCLIHTARKTLVSGCKNSIIPTDGSVTSIGDYAFSSCDSLTSVTIPDSVARIGDWAFYNCTSLTSVTIGDGFKSIGRYAFSGCTSLTSVIVDGMTSIGDYAFSGCSSLTNVMKGDSVTSIGNYAFYSCDSLTSVTIGGSVTSVGDYAFAYCERLTSVTIPDNVTNIGSSAFQGCTSLTSITLPFVGASKDGTSNTRFSYIFGDGIPSSLKTVIITGDTSIGDSAFYNCDSLTSVTIGDSVTSIGDRAFYSCTNLRSVTIGDSVTSIGSSAFRDCTSLTSVTIGGSVTSIGVYAFDTCASLTSVHITDLAAWCGISFSSNPLDYAHNLYLDGTLIEKLVIPSGVTSIGEYAFSGCESFTSVMIPDSVKSVGDYAFLWCNSLMSVTIPNSVTSIGSSAFQGCTSLTSVTIGDGVTSIGSKAFYNCDSLTSITLPFVGASKDGSSNTHFSYIFGNRVPSSLKTVIITGDTSIGDSAFYNCDSLTSVTIGDGVTSIGGSAFSDCSSLKSVTIGDGVTSIGDYAFRDCDSLTSVHITDLASWCGISFSNSSANPLYYAHNLYLNGALVKELVIPSGVTSIGSYAFRNCTSLTSVTISDSVTSIGSSAFYNCTSLTSVTIPDSVTSIGSYAFYHCESLTSVTIPDSVTSIGGSAFSDCSSLKSVTIGGSVTSIGDCAFSDCTSLTSVTIPKGVTSIGAYPFLGCSALESITVEAGNTVYHSKDNCLIDTADKLLVSGCNNSIIPTDGSVTSIGDRAFYYCTSLTSVTIGDSVTSIGDYAFEGCDSLTSVTIGGSVTSIGEWAFYNCDSLTSVTIPDSVTSIGDYAFGACDSLTSVTIGDSVTSIGDMAFYSCDSLTSVTIGGSVTSIGNRAFRYCYALKVVYLASPTVAKELTSSTSCEYLVENALTIAIASDIIEIGSYVTENYTYVDTITYLGVEYNVYSKHSHTDNATIWEDYIDGDYTGKKCANCGLIKDNPCPLGHDLSPATCTSPASCSRCSYTEGKALGHNWQGASCYAPATCSRCGATTGGNLGHNVKPATCTSPAKCQNPGCHYTASGALGHDMAKATCTEPSHCVREGCDHVAGKAAGHKWGNWEREGDIETRVCKNDPTHTETRTVETVKPDKHDRPDPTPRPNDDKHPHKPGAVANGTLSEENVTVNDSDKILLEVKLNISEEVVAGNVEIVEDLMKALDGKEITVGTDVGSLMLDAIASAKLAAQNTNISVSLENITNDEETASGKLVIAINVTANGEELLPPEESAENGMLTVTVQYAKGLHPEQVRVSYLAEDGTREEVTVLSYDPETGLVTFETSHLSDYEVSFVEMPEGELAVKSANVNISSDITLKYHVSVPEGYENVYAVFTFGGNTYTVRSYTLDAQGRYVFAFTSIAPQQMGDEISLTVYAEYQGEIFTATHEGYSVKQYCANLLAKHPEDRKLEIMLSDLLTYGAKSQLYRDYKTDALVTDGLVLDPSAFTPLDATANKKALLGEKDETVFWKSVGLRYENTMAMYFRFYAADISDLTVTVRIKDRSVTYTAADFTDEGNGYYRIDFRGILATEFDETVSASFLRNGDTVGQTATYSVDTYVYLYGASEGSALASLLQATRVYGEAAKLYTDPTRIPDGVDPSKDDIDWEA